MKQERLGQSKKKSIKNTKKQMLANAKYRAKIFDLPFNLKLKDIEIPNRCPLLDVKFGEGWYAPSLDRITPEKGYVSGNVKVITKKANVMKNSATLDELLKFSYNINIYMSMI